VRRTFKTKGAAKSWRQDMIVAIRRGEVSTTSTQLTLDDAVKEWLKAADAGTVRTRGGRPFAPASIRAVRQNYRLRVKEGYGRRRLDRITLLDLQEFVDELDAASTHPSTIENTVLPLRVVYRRAKSRGDVQIDPTDGLELPEKTSRGSVSPHRPQTPPSSWPPSLSGTRPCGPPPCSPASAVVNLRRFAGTTLT
jgi:hypothetical protein